VHFLLGGNRRSTGQELMIRTNRQRRLAIERRAARALRCAGLLPAALKVLHCN
jgi:hypothetical protein